MCGGRRGRRRPGSSRIGITKWVGIMGGDEASNVGLVVGASFRTARLTSCSIRSASINERSDYADLIFFHYRSFSLLAADTSLHADQPHLTKLHD